MIEAETYRKMRAAFIEEMFDCIDDSFKLLSIGTFEKIIIQDKEMYFNLN